MIAFVRRNIELIFWIAGLGFLALQNPEIPFSSMCLFDLVGWHNCPGCGIGTSISFLFDGRVFQSIQTHFLGIPLTLAILYRIYEIYKRRELKIKLKMIQAG